MTRQFSLLVIVLGIGISALATEAAAQSKDPLVGVWTLNVAKSKFSPGPAPKSQTTTIEAVGRSYKVTVKTEPAVGGAFTWSYTTALDGRDSPITGDNPNATTANMKRVSPNTTETLFKKGGKPTTSNSAVVSADGKVRTVTTKGVDGLGRQVYNVAVFEKM